MVNSSASGGFATRPHRGSAPGLRWRTSVPQTSSDLLPRDKFLATPLVSYIILKPAQVLLRGQLSTLKLRAPNAAGSIGRQRVSSPAVADSVSGLLKVKAASILWRNTRQHVHILRIFFSHVGVPVRFKCLKNYSESAPA